LLTLLGNFFAGTSAGKAGIDVGLGSFFALQ
jgi:hypothetical protein